MARKDILGLPYASCVNCTYRAEQISLVRYGPRTSGLEIKQPITLACDRPICRLERDLWGGDLAPSQTSENLLSSESLETPRGENET